MGQRPYQKKLTRSILRLVAKKKKKLVARKVDFLFYFILFLFYDYVLKRVHGKSILLGHKYHIFKYIFYELFKKKKKNLTLEIYFNLIDLTNYFLKLLNIKLFKYFSFLTKYFIFIETNF
jgi:hypothetical protein